MSADFEIFTIGFVKLVEKNIESINAQMIIRRATTKIIRAMVMSPMIIKMTMATRRMVRAERSLSQRV